MSNLEVLRVLGEALAVGLLVGIERYKDRDPGEKKTAGVRTFAIFSLLGAVCGLIDQTPLTLVTFAAVAGLLLTGYYRREEESLGLTTEIAALLVFWIGYLLRTHETPAISLGIVLTIFLTSKRALHDFVRSQVSAAEWYATLKFLAVVLVIYPILPDRQLGPLGFFNPREFWGLVILVSTISYCGYFLARWLGREQGIKLSGLVGGLVSTTAVTMSLSAAARDEPEASRLYGAAAVLASTVQPVRLLVLTWIVNHDLGLLMTPALAGMSVVGLGGAWYLSGALRSDPSMELPLRNPYSITSAMKFGFLFLGILFLVNLANRSFGHLGALVAAAVAGIGSSSAAALTLSGLVAGGLLDPSHAAIAILAAIATNALTKWLIAWVNGTPRMAVWLGLGLLSLLVTGAVLLFATTAYSR